MSRRISIALLAACFISGLCTYLLGRKIRIASMPHNHGVLRYAAPAHPLSMGEVLRQEDLEWMNWPIDNPLLGASNNIERLAGRVVLYPLDQGQPILERDLAEPGTGGGLASRIPKGLRALALRSDDVVGVAGFLAPGSRLDVLVTYRADNSSQAVTETVLQNSEVLAAGQRLEPDPTGKPASATVVTLLLSPIEAERAVLASTQGTVHFVLRNALDTGHIEETPISLTAAARPVNYPLGHEKDLTAASTATVHRGKYGVYEGQAKSGVETILGGDHDMEGKQP